MYANMAGASIVFALSVLLAFLPRVIGVCLSRACSGIRKELGRLSCVLRIRRRTGRLGSYRREFGRNKDMVMGRDACLLGYRFICLSMMKNIAHGLRKGYGCDATNRGFFRRRQCGELTLGCGFYSKRYPTQDRYEVRRRNEITLPRKPNLPSIQHVFVPLRLTSAHPPSMNIQLISPRDYDSPPGKQRARSRILRGAPGPALRSGDRICTYGTEIAEEPAPGTARRVLGGQWSTFGHGSRLESRCA